MSSSRTWIDFSPASIAYAEAQAQAGRLSCRYIEVTRHAASMQAYTDDRYRRLLREIGFGDVEFHPALSGREVDKDSRFIVIVSRNRMTLHDLVERVVGQYPRLADAETPGLIEGLYLEGSVALEDFHPRTSDIDFVAVTGAGRLGEK